MAKLPSEKQRILDEVKRFIEEEESWLQEIMNYVGWNIEDSTTVTTVNPPTYELCPINNEHRVPRDSMDAHISKCWKKHGTYPDASLDVSISNDDSASTSKTVDLSSLTPSNECSTSTSQPSTSLIELLTAERDAKRRRATYRKKGVSTNKKSYNEVLRELIDNEMKTLEYGLKTEDESTSCSTEERAAKKSVYAGVGNWIYHGNPYKRWMTIEDEEQEHMKSLDDGRTEVTDCHSKYSGDKSRHSHDDRLRGRDYDDRSSRQRDRLRSYRYDRHFDDSGRHKRLHSDQHRDLLEDRPEREKPTNFPRSEHRHREERRKSDFSSKQSSVYDAKISKRERSFQKSPSRDRKRRKRDEKLERMSDRSSKSHVKREPRASSKDRKRESIENSVKKVEESEWKPSPNQLNLENEGTALHNTEKHEDVAELSNSNRRSSKMKKKHRKKKKKHKKLKKKKRHRSSSPSSS